MNPARHPDASSLPAASSVQRFYRFHAIIYDWTRWMILHGRRRAVELLDLRADSQVLEIGCGTGLNFPLLLERLDPRAGRLVGVDFSPDMLRRAQRRVDAQRWPHVELVQADATQLQLGRRFDSILFAYSLTMIPDWPAALRRAAEHLQPNGRVVVLDFGQFERWGPLAGVMRGWLRANHVETLRDYVGEVARCFDDVRVERRLGGYNFIVVGRGS